MDIHVCKSTYGASYASRLKPTAFTKYMKYRDWS